MRKSIAIVAALCIVLGIAVLARTSASTNNPQQPGLSPMLSCHRDDVRKYIASPGVSGVLIDYAGQDFLRGKAIVFSILYPFVYNNGVRQSYNNNNGRYAPMTLVQGEASTWTGQGVSGPISMTFYLNGTKINVQGTQTPTVGPSVEDSVQVVTCYQDQQ